MNIATITVSGIRASVSECCAIPAGTAGATVTFIFTDPLWDTLSKTAVFRGCVTRDVLMEGSTVTIPQEVLAEKGACLEIGVCGTHAEGGLAILTLWAFVGFTLDSADPSGDPAADPTLPIWAQLQEQIQDLSDRTTGGYYLPEVTQPQADAVRFNFSPSRETMPAVEPVQIALPGNETQDYTQLSGKPSINGVELSGDKSLEELGIGQPTDEQIGSAVSGYLEAHPEATTTVQDGSITEAKLADDIRRHIHVNSAFAGKTAVFYGDSLTEANSHYTKGYHQWLAEILGLGTCSNYGMSGYTTADIYNKVNSVSDASDIVFVMCGINDQTFSVPLGTPEDTTAETTYGALNLLCSLLKQKYPTSLVVFITPHQQTKYIHSEGITSCDIARAIKAVCEKHAIAVYDNYTLSGIHSSNLSFFTTDNCHWNDLGHELTGRNLAGFLLATFSYIHGSSPGQEEQDPTVAVTGISLNAASGMLTVGNSLVLTATIVPENATNKTVLWTSSSPDIASVSGGTVTALSQGTAEITATTEDGGFQASFQLTVNPAVEEIVTLQHITADFSQGNAIIYTTDVLDTLRQYLTVTAHYSDGSSEAVTSYVLTGALEAGDNPITVTYSGKTATFTVSAAEPPYVVADKTVEITGVKFASQWHVSLYVTKEDLPALSGDVTFGFEMTPLTDFVVAKADVAGGTGGIQTVDVPHDLLAGFTTIGLSQHPVLEETADGSCHVFMTKNINATADRAYWCFPIDMKLVAGNKFLLSNYYVETDGVKLPIVFVGGAFAEETCIIT